MKVERWAWVIIALAIVAVVVGVIVYGYMTRPGWVGVSGKKFWDYLALLIVPAALAFGVAWLNWAQSKREREAEDAQQERERLAEAAQRERELEVENQRAQDEALQAYLKQMGDLILHENLLERVRGCANRRVAYVPRRSRGTVQWL